MFKSKLLEQRIHYLEELAGSQQEELAKIQNELEDEEYLDWKRMSHANAETAAKQGYWYLNSKTDIQLLESVLQRINENPDLTALFRTADGTTLSLRVHEQPKVKLGLDYGKFSEDE